MPSRVLSRRRAVYRVSFSVIFAVFFVLSTSVAVGVATTLHRLSLTVTAAVADPPPPPVDPKYLVVLVLDGGEPGYLRLGSLPHLDALQKQGVSYDNAFAGILESETPAGHATLSTGSTPAHDGLLGFNWIRNDNDAVRLFDPSAIRSGQLEQVMHEAGAPTIASIFKARYPHAKVVAVSGHKYYAADPLGGPAADYILYYASDLKGHYVPTAVPGHVPPASILDDPALTTPTVTLPPGAEDSLAVRLAMASFRKVHQQITLINIPEFDWPLGHVYGGETARARVLMQSFDRDLGYIEQTYRRAGVLGKTVFVVTADHGMAPLKYQIPDSVMDDAVAASGTTSPETTYSTAGYVWLQDSTRAQAVADGVVRKQNPHVQSVYYKVITSVGDSYVRAGGLPISPQVDNANQYLLESFIGGNAPDVVAFCTEDAAFVTKGAESWKGNHGGAAWGSQHIPLIISGAGVAQGRLSHAPARLEDVAPTVLSLFGLSTPGMQGSLLADALANPTRAQTRAQETLDAALTPVVEALKAESRRELSQ
jgi:arylsulfatase A-like enzyme